MTKITVTIDGETKEFDSFYGALKLLSNHDGMRHPACKKCGKTNWKTWDGSAYCMSCGKLLCTDDFHDMMGFGPI